MHSGKYYHISRQYRPHDPNPSGLKKGILHRFCLYPALLNHLQISSFMPIFRLFINCMIKFSVFPSVNKRIAFQLVYVYPLSFFVSFFQVVPPVCFVQQWEIESLYLRRIFGDKVDLSSISKSMSAPSLTLEKSVLRNRHSKRY